MKILIIIALFITPIFCFVIFEKARGQTLKDIIGDIIDVFMRVF
jgi:hypothetical protein